MRSSTGLEEMHGLYIVAVRGLPEILSRMSRVGVTIVEQW